MTSTSLGHLSSIIITQSTTMWTRRSVLLFQQLQLLQLEKPTAKAL